MIWAKVRGLTNWGTQASSMQYFLNYMKQHHWPLWFCHIILIYNWYQSLVPKTHFSFSLFKLGQHCFLEKKNHCPTLGHPCGAVSHKSCLPIGTWFRLSLSRSSSHGHHTVSLWTYESSPAVTTWKNHLLVELPMSEDLSQGLLRPSFHLQERAYMQNKTEHELAEQSDGEKHHT